MDELFEQTRSAFVADPIESRNFTKRMAFNVIPHIDDFRDDGFTKEEWKLTVETKKMLDPEIEEGETTKIWRNATFLNKAEEDADDEPPGCQTQRDAVKKAKNEVEASSLRDALITCEYQEILKAYKGQSGDDAFTFTRYLRPIRVSEKAIIFYAHTGLTSPRADPEGDPTSTLLLKGLTGVTEQVKERRAGVVDVT